MLKKLQKLHTKPTKPDFVFNISCKSILKPSQKALKIAVEKIFSCFNGLRQNKKKCLNSKITLGFTLNNKRYFC